MREQVRQSLLAREGFTEENVDETVEKVMKLPFSRIEALFPMATSTPSSASRKSLKQSINEMHVYNLDLSNRSVSSGSEASGSSHKRLQRNYQFDKLPSRTRSPGRKRQSRAGRRKPQKRKSSSLPPPTKRTSIELSSPGGTPKSKLKSPRTERKSMSSKLASPGSSKSKSKSPRSDRKSLSSKLASPRAKSKSKSPRTERKSLSSKLASPGSSKSKLKSPRSDRKSLSSKLASPGSSKSKLKSPRTDRKSLSSKLASPGSSKAKLKSPRTDRKSLSSKLASPGSSKSKLKSPRTKRKIMSSEPGSPRSQSKSRSPGTKAKSKAVAGTLSALERADSAVSSMNSLRKKIRKEMKNYEFGDDDHDLIARAIDMEYLLRTRAKTLEKGLAFLNESQVSFSFSSSDYSTISSDSPLSSMSSSSLSDYYYREEKRSRYEYSSTKKKPSHVGSAGGNEKRPPASTGEALFKNEAVGPSTDGSGSRPVRSRSLPRLPSAKGRGLLTDSEGELLTDEELEELGPSGGDSNSRPAQRLGVPILPNMDTDSEGGLHTDEELGPSGEDSNSRPAQRLGLPTLPSMDTDSEGGLLTDEELGPSGEDSNSRPAQRLGFPALPSMDTDSEGGLLTDDELGPSGEDSNSRPAQRLGLPTLPNMDTDSASGGGLFTDDELGPSSHDTAPNLVDTDSEKILPSPDNSKSSPPLQLELPLAPTLVDTELISVSHELGPSGEDSNSRPARKLSLPIPELRNMDTDSASGGRLFTDDELGPSSHDSVSNPAQSLGLAAAPNLVDTDSEEIHPSLDNSKLSPPLQLELPSAPTLMDTESSSVSHELGPSGEDSNSRPARKLSLPIPELRNMDTDSASGGRLFTDDELGPSSHDSISRPAQRLGLAAAPNLVDTDSKEILPSLDNSKSSPPLQLELPSAPTLVDTESSSVSHENGVDEGAAKSASKGKPLQRLSNENLHHESLQTAGEGTGEEDRSDRGRRPSVWRLRNQKTEKKDGDTQRVFTDEDPLDSTSSEAPETSNFLDDSTVALEVPTSDDTSSGDSKVECGSQDSLMQKSIRPSIEGSASAGRESEYATAENSSKSSMEQTVQSSELQFTEVATEKSGDMLDHERANRTDSHVALGSSTTDASTATTKEGSSLPVNAEVQLTNNSSDNGRIEGLPSSFLFEDKTENIGQAQVSRSVPNIDLSVYGPNPNEDGTSSSTLESFFNANAEQYSKETTTAKRSSNIRHIPKEDNIAFKKNLSNVKSSQMHDRTKEDPFRGNSSGWESREQKGTLNSVQLRPGSSRQQKDSTQSNIEHSRLRDSKTKDSLRGTLKNRVDSDGGESSSSRIARRNSAFESVQLRQVSAHSDGGESSSSSRLRIAPRRNSAFESVQLRQVSAHSDGGESSSSSKLRIVRRNSAFESVQLRQVSAPQEDITQASIELLASEDTTPASIELRRVHDLAKEDPFIKGNSTSSRELSERTTSSSRKQLSPVRPPRKPHKKISKAAQADIQLPQLKKVDLKTGRLITKLKKLGRKNKKTPYQNVQLRRVSEPQGKDKTQANQLRRIHDLKKEDPFNKGNSSSRRDRRTSDFENVLTGIKLRPVPKGERSMSAAKSLSAQDEITLAKRKLRSTRNIRQLPHGPSDPLSKSMRNLRQLPHGPSDPLSTSMRNIRQLPHGQLDPISTSMRNIRQLPHGQLDPISTSMRNIRQLPHAPKHAGPKNRQSRHGSRREPVQNQDSEQMVKRRPSSVKEDAAAEASSHPPQDDADVEDYDSKVPAEEIQEVLKKGNKKTRKAFNSVMRRLGRKS